MHPTNCLNCATLLTADDRFCPTCGQKTDTHRLRMSHIWHDIGHAFTHTDKGFFYTIKELALRPGKVAREYISGKRKKYFNPFSFLFIIVGIYLIANSVFKPYTRGIETLEKSPPWAKTESQKKRYAQILERSHKFGEFMNKKTNVVLFISTPFIAAILWLLYKRRGYYYAEHFVVMAYTNGFLALLTIFIFAPLIYLSRIYGGHNLIYASMMLSHVLYIGYMYHGFIGYTTKKAYFRTIGAGFLAILAWAALSMGIGVIYIRYGFWL